MIRQMQIIPLYFWPIKKLLPILVAIIVACSLAVYYAFTFTSVSESRALQTKQAQLLAVLGENQRQMKQIQFYNKQLELLRTVESRTQSRLVTKDELTSLLIQINQLADTANVHIVNLKPMVSDLAVPGSAGTAFNSKIFTFEIKAKYLNYIDFLAKITTLSKLVHIYTLKISRIDDNIIHANFELQVVANDTENLVNELHAPITGNWHSSELPQLTLRGESQVLLPKINIFAMDRKEHGFLTNINLLNQKFTLNQLQMVGYINYDGRNYALLKTPVGLIKVSQGDKIADGQIVKISSSGTEIEQIQRIDNRYYTKKIFMELLRQNHLNYKH